jgi:thiol-disulfide isomerase/thioredoxin
MKNISSLRELQASLKNEKNPVIIMIHATWCSNCRRMYPIIQELDKHYNGKIVFIMVDSDQGREIMSYYDVEAFPTFLSIRNSEKVNELVGANPSALADLIQGVM